MEYLNWSHRNMYERNYNNAVVPNEFRRYHPNHPDHYPQQQQQLDQQYHHQQGFARDQRQEQEHFNEGLFHIKNEAGFRAAIGCAVIDVVLSISFLLVILTLTPILLQPPPPKLVVFAVPPPKSSFINETLNITFSKPSNTSGLPLQKKFYCKRIIKQALMSDFLAQLVYTGGGVSVIFGALSRRASLCAMHFPCTLIAIIIGIGIRIIETIYCKWYLMRWLWFIIQFVWFTFGDGVAKSLIVYIEERWSRMGRTTHQNLIIPNT